MEQNAKAFSQTDKIAFIGGGKMAEAIIFGLIDSKRLLPNQIIVSDISLERRKRLSSTFHVETAADNIWAVSQANIAILAVKPQILSDVLKDLNFSSISLVISIAAGIKIDHLEKMISQKPVIRAMPNNPALVQKGITAICPGNYAKQSDIELALSIFKTVGAVIQIKEDLMDAVTGLSGSGPAFIYLVIEAMIEAGEKLGLTKSIAEVLAFNTVLGSAETLIRTGKQAGELREMVTSPGGTTRAGLDILESRGFAQILSDAIIAAAKRSSELSKS